VKHFDALYGREATEEILRFYNEEKYTDISVNTTRISVEAYLSILAEAGIFAEENASARGSLRIFGSVNPEAMPGFAEGYFFVQDRASAICAEALSPKVGQLVVDVCAAPGGKSFAAAICGEDKLDIRSFDLHSSKLSLIESGRDRLGLGSITVAQRDATSPDESLLGMADRVICDAPCSGLGVLGKKPDLRYKSEESVAELPALQQEILTASAKYLKAGGEILYSTCTLRKEENEEVVEKFLECNPEFTKIDFKVGNLTSTDGMLTLLPHVHNTDGFFMAKLKKTR
jgi:16S rRNA (cytosine967-C5)-methyltransferase